MNPRQKQSKRSQHGSILVILLVPEESHRLEMEVYHSTLVTPLVPEEDHPPEMEEGHLPITFAKISGPLVSLFRESHQGHLGKT
jgi:hypothetical protein